MNIAWNLVFVCHWFGLQLELNILAANWYPSLA
jgi:hypothetical protein